MPYENPTVADLKARFPVFSGVDDTVLQGALDEASGKVDQTWREADFKPAQLLYAAHILTLDGHGTGQEAKFRGLANAGISGIKIASLSLTMRKDGSDVETSANGAVVSRKSSLTQTSFGKRYQDLLRVNQPAIAIAGAGYVAS